MFTYSLGEHQQGSAISDLYESRHVVPFSRWKLRNQKFVFHLQIYCLITSSMPFAIYKRPGLPRMGLVTNGTRFSQTEIPNRKFPNFLKMENAQAVQSLNSLFFPPPLGAGGRKESTLFSPARV